MAVVEQRVALGAIEELAVQVVQESLDENPDDENSDGIINRPHLYSEERLDALRFANSHMEKWITQRAIVSRVKASHSMPSYSKLTNEELEFFETEAQFEEWLKS